jgi:hypothetical protein
MGRRATLGLLAAFGLAGGCGGEETALEAAPEATAPIGGLYEVHGTTVGLESGHKREIAGTVILAEDGDRYTATFNLTTTYPGAEEALPAEVIGKGQGAIDGRTLRGSAQTQLVMATVPGVDPGFAFVPRMVSTRIVSETVTTIAADGTVSIEIENQPAPGESYAPTRTTLRGERVSAVGIGGFDEAARKQGGKAP